MILNPGQPEAAPGSESFPVAAVKDHLVQAIDLDNMDIHMLL